VSTIDLSHNAKEARSQRNGRGHRGSPSVNNGTTNAAPMPIDDTNTTRLRNQLPWAPVLLNPQRLAFAAIGAVRHGANYTSQLASIVTGGSPIGPKKGDWRFADPAFTDHPIYRRTRFMRSLKRQRGITHSTWNDLWGWSVHVRQRRDRQM
jgi:hypothetical protein